jgi:alcohol dehydrogenase class IV
VWPLEKVQRLSERETAIWPSPSVRQLTRNAFPFSEWTPRAPLTTGWLVVVGGGTMIDEAKQYVHDSAPSARLIAIPSIWGSGAEASPVVVLNRGGKKEIAMGDEFLPYARAVWPELANTISDERAREACGDTWAHAVEGFLSPLASDELRTLIAGIIREMLALPVAADSRWFDVSARAAAAQARSSVGLVHGIAHVIEGPMTAALGAAWGHARLCATYLVPVLRFHRRAGSKVEDLFRQYGLDVKDIEAMADRLFDRSMYRQTLPILEAEWQSILRDRCTRTNATLVRRDDLQFFKELAP